MHSGHISVSSAGKNLGSTFTVTLPIAGEEAGANEKLTYSKVRDTVSLKGFSILVVDDEKEARDVVKLVLERKGAKVIEASTAVEGIRKYEDFLPDIIVSDISMPEEDGFSFLQRLRRLETETDRFTPAIALTAYARDEDRKKSLAAGFQAHLVKPFLPQELLQVVNATLAKFNDD